MGGVLSAETIPRLRCRIVAGSANNQLDTPEDANRLHERGILYAPDYVINAGGAIAFGRMHLAGADGDPLDDETLREEVRRIEPMLREIFAEAGERRPPGGRAPPCRPRAGEELRPLRKWLLVLAFLVALLGVVNYGEVGGYIFLVALVVAILLVNRRWLDKYGKRRSSAEGEKPR